MLHELANHCLDRFTLQVELFYNAVWSRGANVRLLGGIEFRVHNQAMFQIVDAKLGRLAETHRAQVAGNFRSARVSGLDGRTELRARDVHVCLKGGHSLINPVVHKAHGVFGSGQYMQLWREGAHTLEIGPGDLHLGTWNLARVDEFLEREIGVRFEASGGAQGSSTASEIQPRKAEAHLA